MKLQKALRNYLQQHFPTEVHKEPWCTCGSANHVRMFSFRVNGRPTMVLVPEGCELDAAQFGRALSGARIEPLAGTELDNFYPQGKLGPKQEPQNPFRTAVYMDHNLAQFDTLVFCPKMLNGKAGECFRVPIKDFRALIFTVVLPLYPIFTPAPEA